MTTTKIYSLCEAVADIAFIAANEQYETNDTRQKFAQFIEWAKDFESLHKDIQWVVNSELDYIDSIYYFAMFKINQWRSI